LSNNSNNHGRAYEYAWIETLNQALRNFGAAKIIENSAFVNNKTAWEKMTTEQQTIYKISAQAAVKTIFELEPQIFADSNDELTLEFLSDSFGIKGDVRDIVIRRKNLNWEIGLSIKHNHDAIKHSRLSHKIDFGKEWFDSPCSNDYWNAINPIFYRLKKLKLDGVKWSNLTDKNESVYVPLLQAFINEINHSCEVDKNIPRKIVEYLIGVKDYYKIISHDSEMLTIIQTFNLHGNLNQPNKKIVSAITVPKVFLPTELVALKFKNNSPNTVEMYLNNGWQLSFRIHNASTKVEPSLKFDIQFIGMPPSVISLKCFWNDI
jgi:hypothetical protein